MLTAKAGSHQSHVKRDLNFFLNQIQLPSLLTLIGFFPVICLFRQTLTPRDDTRLIRAKMRSLHSIFAGKTSRALAFSLAFTAENINNLPLALRTF